MELELVTTDKKQQGRKETEMKRTMYWKGHDENYVLFLNLIVLAHSVINPKCPDKFRGFYFDCLKQLLFPLLGDFNSLLYFTK